MKKRATSQLAPIPRSLSLPSNSSDFLPVLIVRAGERTAKKFLEFFAATIRNDHTRATYARAVSSFLDWCEEQGFGIDTIEPMTVALYIRMLEREKSPSTVKVSLAAIRMLFDFFVVEQVVAFNPASSVKGPRISNKEGKTPVLFEEEANQLLKTIDTSTLKGLRDRAIISSMIYTFARVSAICRMNVGHFEVQGRKAFYKLSEKGGKFRRIACHHKALEFMEAYLWASGIDRHEERDEPLFRTFRGRSDKLTKKRIDRWSVRRMVKKAAEKAEFYNISPHSLRATGITNYLGNGGDVLVAQEVAGHADVRTTRIYDRNQHRNHLAELERIRVGLEL